MTHSFFLKLWPEMSLGATVKTRKQNKHRANGKLLILQKQGRLNRFDQMLRSCWLVFLMLMELCTRNLFLLDKPCIKNLFEDVEKLREVVRKKRPEMWSSGDWFLHTTMPLPTRPWVCSRFWQKTTRRLSLILRIHPTMRHAAFSCSLVWKARWKGNVLLMSAKWKRKRWRSWTTSARKSFRNVFSSGKNVGTSVLSEKESTLKETRVVIV